MKNKGNAGCWVIVFGMFVWNRIYLLLNRMMRNDVRADMTSHTQLPDVEQQPTTYSTVTCQNYLIRVLTKDYQRNVHLVFYCCFFWVILAFASSVLLMSKAVNLGPFPFFIVIAVGFLPLNAFALYKYQIFQLGFTLSSILFNIIVAVISIVIAMSIPFASTAFGIYLIMEITANCLLVQNKGKIMLKCLLLLQVFIICLKLDNTITFSWDQVMFGFIIICLFFALVSLFLFGYSFLIASWCLRESYHEIKSIGLRFLACNFLSLASLIAVPLWSVYVNDNYHVPAICSILLTYVSGIFTFFKRTEIALFLCESFQVPKKETPFKIEAKDTFGMKNLFQISSNWFLQQNQTTCAGELQIEQCVVCMNSQAETVWRPCGHCILCYKCMNDLIATDNIRCPLCKSNPTEIVKLSKKTQLNASILAKNEYEIETCISIKHT